MIEPNATLYVKNLDWKIKKLLLRRALYSLFSRHGKVLEIVTLRRDGLRGQAFVIMNTVQNATAALQAEQGFTFFGKDMVIEYARTKSDRIAKRDGDYVPKAKRSKAVATESSLKVTSNDADGATIMEGVVNDETGNAVENENDTAAQPPTTTLPDAPPSKMLLAQNLPSECNEMMLGMLFRQYSGYKEIRMPRSGLAFIEFDDEAQATVAKMALQGFQLTPQDALQLNYAKV